MVTHYVYSPLDGWAPGTLRTTIAQAQPGDTILCLWPIDMWLELNEQLLVQTDNLTLIGNGRIIRFGYGIRIVADQVDVQTFSFDHVAGDGIMVDQPNARTCTILGCIFIGGNTDEDEAISVVRGAGSEWVHIIDCTIRQYYKAILVGTGDPEYAPVEAAAKINMERCILEGNCRRHPRIRYGYAQLKDCTIAYWGAIWKDYCAGVQAGEHATVELENCTFKQHYRYVLRPIKTIRDILAGGGPWRAVMVDSTSVVRGDHTIHWSW